MLKKVLNPGFLSIILLLTGWQIATSMLARPELFPSITDILQRLQYMLFQGDFYRDIGATLLRGFTGISIAGILALLLAVLAVHHKFWKSFFHPIIIILRSIPVISVVLIALLWFSPPSLPVFIALLTMFPILYQNILSGLEMTDIRLIEMAKVYHKNNLQRYFMIYLPGAKKIILDGMATAMGFGWRAIIIGEALASPVHAIGTGMKRAQSFIQMDNLLSWTVVAILISFLFDYIIRQFNRKERKSAIRISHKTDSPVDNTKVKKKPIEVKNIRKSFRKNILVNIGKLELKPKTVYLLNSPSGSGKTTFFRLLTNIIRNDGNPVNLKVHISMAFQDNRLVPWLTVKENIAFSLPGYPQLSETENNRILTLSNATETEHLLNVYPALLSGGEAKRISVLRALLLPADVLILDEPYAGLDQTNKLNLNKLIEDYIEQNQAIVFLATHEKNMINTVPVQSISLITDNIV